MAETGIYLCAHYHTVTVEARVPSGQGLSVPGGVPSTQYGATRVTLCRRCQKPLKVDQVILKPEGGWSSGLIYHHGDPHV